MKIPNSCPNSNYVEGRIFDLISRQVEISNADAFSMGATLRYVTRRALAKLIAHLKIYELVKDLPGHIVELGVFKGESLLRFAQLAEIFEVYDRSFDIIGFDNFEGFPDFNLRDGAESTVNDKGRCRIKYES